MNLQRARSDGPRKPRRAANAPGGQPRAAREGGGARHSEVQPARRVAFDVLTAVTVEDAYANLVLPAAISRAKLNPADAGLATELSYGTLRMRGYYDRVIALAAHRDVSTIDPIVLDILRLGAHQLLSTRVAPHAAVNESVALVNEVHGRSVTGFVNGVLREITRSTPEEWRARAIETAGNSDDALSAEFSHPAWIIRALRRALAAENRASELTALLEADNRAPRVNLVALPDLAPIPAGAEPNRFAPTGFSVGGGDPENVMRPAGGRIRVQDEGSQLAALMLTRARPVRRGERWLDLCAGPGGKAALLAAEARTHGAVLLANEISGIRADLVRRAVDAVPGDIEVAEIDARDVTTTDDPRFSEPFDRILLDAPCTGLGALRRRPEARWRKSAQDVAQLATLQGELIRAAFDALAPGGILAYVTCSPHVAETRAIVSDALETWGDDATLLNAEIILREIAHNGSESELELGDPFSNGSGRTVQLWPHRNGTDAMFVALIERSPGRP